MPTRVQAILPYHRTREVLRTLPPILRGDFRAGALVRELEAGFAELHPTAGPTTCVALPHARICLYYALRALDLPPGSEVLLTPITIPDMVNVIVSAGLRPRFVDVDVRGLSYGTEALHRAIRAASGGARAMVLTYLYGMVPPNLGEILALAERHGLRVIEDVSQSLGAEYRGARLGTLGDVGFASLSSLKLCGSLFGGMAIGADAHLMRRIRELGESELAPPRRATFLPLIGKLLAHAAMMNDVAYPLVTFRLVRALVRRYPRFHHRFQTGDLGLITGLGHVPRYAAVPDALLTRYTDLQAAMALAALGRLERNNARLARYAAILEDVPGVRALTPAAHPEGRSVYWRFPVAAPDPRRLARELADRGVETSFNALPVLTELDAFRELVTEPCPNAREVDRRYLLLPLHAHFSPDKNAFLARSLAEALAEVSDARPTR